VKAVINSYWIVEVIDVLHGSEFFLLGYKRSAFISSNIRSIDWKNGLVLTKNSMYRLGTQGEGEPDFDARMLACAAFSDWGWGGMMGILPVFY
jgi:hypothetical protein